jgi:hypothetical protein
MAIQELPYGKAQGFVLGLEESALHGTSIGDQPPERSSSGSID